MELGKDGAVVVDMTKEKVPLLPGNCNLENIEVAFRLPVIFNEYKIPSMEGLDKVMASFSNLMKRGGCSGNDMSYLNEIKIVSSLYANFIMRQFAFDSIQVEILSTWLVSVYLYDDEADLTLSSTSLGTLPFCTKLLLGKQTPEACQG